MKLNQPTNKQTNQTLFYEYNKRFYQNKQVFFVCLFYKAWKKNYVVSSISFQTFFVWAFKIGVDSWIAIHLMRWLTNLYEFRFKWTATAAIGIHPTKAWLSQLVNFKNASRQFLSLLIVQTLVPVTFGYSLSSEPVVMRQLRKWKRLWWRSLTRSHKRTSMGPSRSCCNGTTSALQPEEITSKGTRVSCVYYQ